MSRSNLGGSENGLPEEWIGTRRADHSNGLCLPSRVREIDRDIRATVRAAHLRAESQSIFLGHDGRSLPNAPSRKDFFWRQSHASSDKVGRLPFVPTSRGDAPVGQTPLIPSRGAASRGGDRRRVERVRRVKWRVHLYPLHVHGRGF
jgi:hypothetical protein